MIKIYSISAFQQGYWRVMKSADTGVLLLFETPSEAFAYLDSHDFQENVCVRSERFEGVLHADF